MIVPGPGCHSSTHKEIVYKKIVLKSDTKEVLLNFVDCAKDHNDNQIKLSRTSTSKRRCNLLLCKDWPTKFESKGMLTSVK